MFARPNGHGIEYYFEAIEIRALTSGTYTIKTDSDIDTYGYLYSKPFNPNAPFFNLIETDNDNGPGCTFNLTVNLTTSQPIIFVVSTYNLSTTTAFNITVFGPARVYFKSKFLS